LERPENADRVKVQKTEKSLRGRVLYALGGKFLEGRGEAKQAAKIACGKAGKCGSGESLKNERKPQRMPPPRPGREIFRASRVKPKKQIDPASQYCITLLRAKKQGLPVLKK